jgi:two-component system, cell cycle response regulator DivK
MTGKRILVVEDQEDLRGVLRDLLAGSGYAVIEAADGRDGITKAKSDRPDLILMDIQMPVLDGYEATRQIKADADLSATPIIAVSSFAMKRDEEKARAAGCDDYVTKPYCSATIWVRHGRSVAVDDSHWLGGYATIFFRAFYTSS